jgi:heme O synthase-like polyprenyltransferase
MPGVLGWTAVRGRVEWGTLVLFAISFLWQFAHFFSIAWLYREDYAQGGVRMLTVVELQGKSTALRILLCSVVLIPVSLLPSFAGMWGRTYLVGALLLGTGLLWVEHGLPPSECLWQAHLQVAGSPTSASDHRLSADSVCLNDDQLCALSKLWLAR